MELVMGVGPMNLVITNDALYQLSYTSVLLFFECLINIPQNRPFVNTFFKKNYACF